MSVEISHHFFPYAYNGIDQIDDSTFLAPVLEIDTKKADATSSNGWLEVIDEDYASLVRGQVRRLRQIALFHDNNGVDTELQITEPSIEAETTNDPYIIDLPGCSEVYDRGSAGGRHDSLASLNPGSTIVTIQNDGLNHYGRQLSTPELLARDFDTMAASRLDAIAAVSKGDPVSLTTESLGGVVGMHVLHQNITARKVDVSKAVFHADALVSPDVAPVAMGALFLPMMMADSGREMLLHPLQSLRCWNRPDLLSPKSWRAVGSQVVKLLPGEQDALAEEVADSGYREGFQAGLFDPLNQVSKVRKLAHEHENVLSEIDMSGHAAAINYRGTARKITRMLERLEELPKRT